MNIFTLTINPAFDIHCKLPYFEAERENLVESTECFIGGKGINISRALLNAGKESRAIVVLGSDNSEQFLRDLAISGIEYSPIIIKGRIRENFTFHPENGSETRISFRGFEADASLLDVIYGEYILPSSLVTFTGSLPCGISSQDAAEFLEKLKRDGSRLVIDSKSIGLSALKELKPWLIKPNEEEVSAYIGVKNADFDQMLLFARDMHESGIENVIVSLGGRGALLVCDSGEFIAVPPKIEAVSTIGAGDSMIAGFISAFEEGMSKKDCLKTAVAFGSAACLREGTLPPLKDDLEFLAKDIEIFVINS